MTTTLMVSAQSKQRFAQIFNTLAVAMREPVDAAKLHIYYDALSDLSLDAVEAAAEYLRRHGGSFFPTSAAWHERATVEQAVLLKTRLFTAREEPWKVECTACEDSGFEMFWCVGVPLGADGDRPMRYAEASVRACHAEYPHAAHGYTRICPCRPTNRTYQRMYARQRGAGK